MANIIKHKRSSVAGQAPTAAQIDVGELAINFADKKLFTKDAANAVIEVAGSKWTNETGGISRADKIKVGAAGAPASAVDIVGSVSYNALTTTGPMDLLLASRFEILVTANTTFSFVNTPPSRAMEVILRITNGGAFSLIFPANLTWIAGSAPSLKAAGTDIIIFWTHDGGTTWLAEAVGQSKSGGANYYGDASLAGSVAVASNGTQTPSGLAFPYTSTVSGVAILEVFDVSYISSGPSEGGSWRMTKAIVPIAVGDVISWFREAATPFRAYIRLNGVDQAMANGQVGVGGTDLGTSADQMGLPRPAGTFFPASYVEGTKSWDDSVLPALQGQNVAVGDVGQTRHAYAFRILTA
jgi:hypothetical protein